jgi:hypothetical protein
MRGQLQDGFTRIVGFNQERKEGLICLHRRITKLASDQALDIEKSPRGVGGSLVLGRVTDETTAVRQEGKIRRRNAIPLFIRADIDPSVPPDGDTRVGRSQVNANAGAGTLGIRRTAAPTTE